MANALTTIRLLLIGPVCWALLNPLAHHPILLALMIAVAIATDYADGKVARWRGTASARGMLFDHGTDFLFVTSTLAALASLGTLPRMLPVLIALAFSQYVLDSYFLYRQKSLRMSALGRWNGILYFGPTLLIALGRLPLPFAASELFTVSAQLLAVVLIASTGLSIVDRALAPLKSQPQPD